MTDTKMLGDIDANLAKLEKSLQRAVARVEQTRKQLAELQSSRTLYCVVCKNDSPLSRWVFLQDYWYVEPYSCTGGDYWKPCDMNFAKCPCGTVLRLDTVELMDLNKHPNLFMTRSDYRKDPSPTYVSCSTRERFSVRNRQRT